MWDSISNYVYDTVSVITKIYIFLLYFVSVSLLIMQSQPASIAWTVTSAVAFYHCWSYAHSVLWIRGVVYIWYIVVHNLSLWDMHIYLNFDLINVNHAYSLRILNFANSTVGYKNWCCFVSIKFDVEKSG